jgi:hypothetical protein
MSLSYIEILCRIDYPLNYFPDVEKNYLQIFDLDTVEMDGMNSLGV